LLAEKFLNKVQNQLDRRGHDAIQSHTISLPNGKTLISYGCVLGMRGPITGQPLVDPSNGNWLLWNGEIYDGLPIDPSANDADLLMKYLSDCNGDSNAILQSIERLNGPWSMIYWESSSYSLWMGRDAIGRRSLVWHLPQSHDDIFIISSVGSIDSSPVILSISYIITCSSYKYNINLMMFIRYRIIGMKCQLLVFINTQ
jgi:asparagine synthetase B (glutamine-hydrolysing)